MTLWNDCSSKPTSVPSACSTLAWRAVTAGASISVVVGSALGAELMVPVVVQRSTTACASAIGRSVRRRIPPITPVRLKPTIRLPTSAIRANRLLRLSVSLNLSTSVAIQNPVASLPKPTFAVEKTPSPLTVAFAAVLLVSRACASG